MAGRKCTICSHGKVEKVNSLLANEKSFRHIASQILGDEKHYRSVARHAEHLGYDLQIALKERRVEKAIDYHDERAQAMQKVKKLIAACEEWLSDPDDSEKFSLNPRSDDLQVVFDDYNTMFMGKPTRKKAMLNDLLEDLYSSHNLKAVKVVNMQMDNRKVFLDAMKNIDVKLDAIAKTEGLYSKEKENPDTIAQLASQVANQIIEQAKKLNISPQTRYEQAEEVIKPELREKVIEIVSEANN